ncbi:hypothetical protein BOX15_Mlig026386g1, partial [Macrostomum lignano]
LTRQSVWLPLPSFTRGMLTSSPSVAMATISIDKPRSLVDERISIRVENLPSNAPVTLRLNIKESYGSFSAFGHYMSDSSGCLSPDSSSSLGGTYTGVDSMGLFWSLLQDPAEKSGLRLLRREAEIPLRYQLTALPGHVTWEQLTNPETEIKPFCSANLERTYLADSVERIPVRVGRLRGALFKPRSQRSCPPVIDLFGTGGGLMEHRSALLAKEGFSVLALAYFNYEDLPDTIVEYDMDYFEEAVDFMLACPYSRLGPKGGVGLIGVSAGADIVANAAILFGDKIRAVAWLNGTPCRNFYQARYQGRLLPAQVIFNASKIKQAAPNPLGIDLRECVQPTRDQELPVEQASARFLFFSCLDDYSVSPEAGARLADRLVRAGRTDVERIAYPDAGHLLEPPISPCTALCYHGLLKVYMYYGGKPEWHHRAQVDSWARMIRMFHEELGWRDDGRQVAKL